MELILKKKLRYGRFSGLTAERSRQMALVRGRGNRSTELAVRMALVRSGIRNWTMHPNEVPGKPDFHFPDWSLAIFVDGCFWHGCRRCGHIPKTNPAYWRAKIERNRMRDAKVRCRLRRSGIRVCRLWEHEIPGRSDGVLQKIRKFLRP